MIENAPSTLPLAQLELRCREETNNHRKGRASDPQFCLEIFGSLGFAVENIRSLASFYRIKTPCPKGGSRLIGSGNGENSFGSS